MPKGKANSSDTFSMGFGLLENESISNFKTATEATNRSMEFHVTCVEGKSYETPRNRSMHCYLIFSNYLSWISL